MAHESAVHEALKKHFGHSKFKSDLQEKAVKCAVKSEYWPTSYPISQIIPLVILLQKSRMCMCRCPRARVNPCASNCLV